MIQYAGFQFPSRSALVAWMIGNGSVSQRDNEAAKRVVAALDSTGAAQGVTDEMFQAFCDELARQDQTQFCDVDPGVLRDAIAAAIAAR